MPRINKTQYYSSLHRLSMAFSIVQVYKPRICPAEDDRYIDCFNENIIKMEYIMFKIGQDLHCFDYSTKYFTDINETVFDAFAKVSDLRSIERGFVLRTIFAKHSRLPIFDVDGCLSLKDECLRDYVVFTIAFKYLILLADQLKNDFETILERRDPVLQEYLLDKPVSNDLFGIRYYEWFLSLMRRYAMSNETHFMFDSVPSYRDHMMPFLTPFAGYGPAKLFYKSKYPSAPTPNKPLLVDVTLKKRSWSSAVEFNLVCLQYQAQIEARILEVIKAEMKTNFSDNGNPRIFYHSNYARSSLLHLEKHALPKVSPGTIFDEGKLISEVSRMSLYGARQTTTSIEWEKQD